MDKEYNKLGNKDLKKVENFYKEVIPEDIKDTFSDAINQKIDQQKEEVEQKKTELKKYKTLNLKNTEGLFNQL